MGNTLAIINQKGGVGKSTTAQTIAAGLTLKGCKTLVIDLDAQGNTSYSFGAGTRLEGQISGHTALDVLLRDCNAEDAIVQTPYADMIPACKRLAAADSLIAETGKEYRLKEALEPVKAKYDFIIIDTPPALGILTVNALTAADSIIIPAQADLYSLQGISDLVETIKPVKKYCNHKLQIEGILLTRFNQRYNFNQAILEMTEKLAAQLETRVFQTTIRESLTVRKAQAARQSLFEYAPKEKITQDYADLINELLKERK